MNSIVKEQKGLQIKQEWLRARDVIELYPICKATLWGWAKIGIVTPIKVSSRVTVFSAVEIRNLFKHGINL